MVTLDVSLDIDVHKELPSMQSYQIIQKICECIVMPELSGISTLILESPVNGSDAGQLSS